MNACEISKHGAPAEWPNVLRCAAVTAFELIRRTLPTGNKIVILLLHLVLTKVLLDFNLTVWADSQQCNAADRRSAMKTEIASGVDTYPYVWNFRIVWISSSNAWSLSSSIFTRLGLWFRHNTAIEERRVTLVWHFLLLPHLQDKDSQSGLFRTVSMRVLYGASWKAS
jgi:hypothetical protein